MKNIVLRKCFGCKILKNREELIKVTLKDNELFINPDSKTTGRSVYVCKNEECLTKFIKTKGIKRGLKFNNDNKIKQIEESLISAIN